MELLVICIVVGMGWWYLYVTSVAATQEEDIAARIENRLKELNEKVDKILAVNVFACRNCVYLRPDEVEVSSAINGACKCSYYCTKYLEPVRIATDNNYRILEVRLARCLKENGFEHPGIYPSNTTE